MLEIGTRCQEYCACFVASSQDDTFEAKVNNVFMNVQTNCTLRDNPNLNRVNHLPRFLASAVSNESKIWASR